MVGRHECRILECIRSGCRRLLRRVKLPSRMANLHSGIAVLGRLCHTIRIESSVVRAQRLVPPVLQIDVEFGEHDIQIGIEFGE